jgi:hypothetical protein
MSGGKAHITGGFIHLKSHGGAKHAVREVCDHLPDNRFVLRSVVKPYTTANTQLAQKLNATSCLYRRLLQSNPPSLGQLRTDKLTVSSMTSPVSG